MMFKPAYFPFCFITGEIFASMLIASVRLFVTGEIFDFRQYVDRLGLWVCLWVCLRTTLSLNITKDIKPISLIYTGYNYLALN